MPSSCVVWCRQVVCVVYLLNAKLIKHKTKPLYIFVASLRRVGSKSSVGSSDCHHSPHTTTPQR